LTDVTLSIPGEGADAEKRGTFSQEQLREAYRTALTGGSEIKLIVPVLGESGARLARLSGCGSLTWTLSGDRSR
jgi:hypothetical protein